LIFFARFARSRNSLIGEITIPIVSCRIQLSREGDSVARKKKKDEPAYTRKPVIAEANTLAMSIREFARLHGISQDQFFKMARDGWGPTVMKVGKRTLISAEAAAEWRRKMEAATA
jgi:hypothetical protein